MTAGGTGRMVEEPKSAADYLQATRESGFDALELSCSHEGNFAVAVVIGESRERNGARARDQQRGDGR